MMDMTKAEKNDLKPEKSTKGNIVINLCEICKVENCAGPIEALRDCKMLSKINVIK